MTNDYIFSIDNYQIIKHADITFKDGLTLLTGKSNNGKSSIFKAFKQLVYNTPGTDFIKHGAPSTHLKLTLTNAYDIVYTKSTNGASYTYSTPTSQPITISKLGTTQPEVISNLTNINKQFDYNFWNQMDKPFLISLSPREQFDLIQQSPHSITLSNCLQHITQDRKTKQTHLTQSQAQLDLLQSQLTQYDQQLLSLPTLTTLFDQLTTLKSTQQQILTLTDTYTKHQSINLSTIQSRLSTLSFQPSLLPLETLLTQINQLSTLYSQLLKTTSPINSINQQISTNKLHQTQTTQFTQTHFTLCPLCNQPFNHDTHQ